MTNALLIGVMLAVAYVDNTAALSCFSRTASTTTGDGTSSACTTYPTCYTYIIASLNYAGCGNCTSISAEYGCSTCGVDNCNTQPTINCNTLSGLGSTSSLVKSACPGSKACYTASLGSLYYGGCGNCYNSIYTNCKNCTTDYCNSSNGSPLAVSGSVKVAAAGVMLMMLMKLL